MHSLPSAIKQIEGARESMHATSGLKENRESSKGCSSAGALLQYFRSTASSLMKVRVGEKNLRDGRQQRVSVLYYS
jgi:hypothetical protein